MPLTDEGNLVVDGVLVSCYASFDHDLAHFAMIPMKWFPGLMEWIFGVDNGMKGYVSSAKIVGRYLMPDQYLYI